MDIVTGRSRVATKYGIVAASQPLAACAGAQVLERGGHAVDAAIAANAVLGVVEPHMNGVGGDLFAIVSDGKTDALHGLNSSGWSPKSLTPAVLQRAGCDGMPASGIHTVTVPGAVAGWAALHERFGRLPLSDDLAAAIFYAENGFPVSDVVADSWNTAAARLGNEFAVRTYLPRGRGPDAGEVFKNPDVARSLRAVANGGRTAFYEGPIGQAIVDLARELGGTMAAEDLREFEPEWVPPLSTTYRGWQVFELPPNTQGIAALLMLDIMEQFPLQDYGCHSVDALHVMIEAKKLAYADMLRYVGDPRTAAVDPEVLLNKAHAGGRAALIDSRSAASIVEPSSLAGLTTAAGADTVYLSAIDADGNIVSLIQSIFEGFGSGLVARGTGFALQNRGALFTLEPGHPNTLAPRRRPLHTIIPGFMRKAGVRIGFGIMGGFNQAQAHAQFVSNIVDFGMDVQQALEAGRFTKATFTGRDVAIEALVPDRTREGLAARGHEIECVPPRSHRFGYGQAVMDNGAGIHFGASDPRHDGAAIPEAPAVFGA